MPEPNYKPDLFPPSDFDSWAPHYDESVSDQGFPLTGYRHALAETVRLAGARAGMTVLDLGTGTGNLAEMFSALGCELWCTDFSSEMLRRARLKIPGAHFFLHDLRQPFPPGLLCRFDRVVSAYVFHHFEQAEKVKIVERIVCDLLAPAGRLVIADISFPTQQALQVVRQSAGNQWEDEPYWIASAALPELAAIGVGDEKLDVTYLQVSECAGIYRLSADFEAAALPE
jgi:ubiquinone/menaquinone biosynthesis C-methylase UbiE